MHKLTPNSLIHPPGWVPKLEELFPGCWIVTNAREGHYEYFPGRPLPGIETGFETELRGESLPSLR